MGDIKAIRQKIQSWAHQELNNPLTMRELERNVLSGQDIFNRQTGTIVQQLDIKSTGVFDEQIKEILLGYPHLIQFNQIEHVEYSRLRDFNRRWRRTVLRFSYEIRKRFLKR